MDDASLTLPDTPIWRMARAYQERPETLSETFRQMNRAAYTAFLGEIDRTSGPERAAGLQMLGLSGDPRAVETLLRRLKHEVPLPPSPDRTTIPATLGERLDKALFPRSVRRVEDTWNADLNELERESDRTHTARLLAHIGDRRAIPLIRELLLDSSDMVRVAARVALEQLERKSREEL
jgi:hypothetical protein